VTGVTAANHPGTRTAHALFRAFDLVISSSFAFRRLAHESPSSPIDLRIEATKRRTAELPSSRPAGADATIPEVFVPLRDCSLLRYPGFADFFVGDDTIRFRLDDTSAHRSLERVLLGSVLAYWLERRGVPTLHGSAVSVGDSAAVFLAGQTGGKSSLALGLTRAGHGFLTDDLVAVRPAATGFRVLPGYPAARLWPDQADYFATDDESLELVDADSDKLWLPVVNGSHRAQPAKLGVVYLPERLDSSATADLVRFEAVSPSAALQMLLRHSFVPDLVAASGHEHSRLHILARLASEIPIVRMRYRAGMEVLDPVCERIADDVLTR
jgi:hypothetical protein